MSGLPPDLDRQSVLRDVLINNWQLSPMPTIYTQADNEAFQERYNRGDLICVYEDFSEDFSDPKGTMSHRDLEYKFTVEIVTEQRRDVINWKEHVYDIFYAKRDRPYNNDYRYWQTLDFTDGTDESKPRKMVIKMNYLMKKYQKPINNN